MRARRMACVDRSAARCAARAYRRVARQRRRSSRHRRRARDRRPVGHRRRRLARAAHGLSHLIAISGLHVETVGAIAGETVSMVWRRLRWRARAATLVFPAPYVAALAALAAAGGYAALAGFNVPAQRAWWMIAAGGIAWPGAACRLPRCCARRSAACCCRPVGRAVGRVLAVVRGGRRDPDGRRRLAWRA